jgi:hypothetical protein
VKPGRREGDTISFVFFSFQIVVALFSLKIWILDHIEPSWLYPRFYINNQQYYYAILEHVQFGMF